MCYTIGTVTSSTVPNSAAPWSVTPRLQGDAVDTVLNRQSPHVTAYPVATVGRGASPEETSPACDECRRKPLPSHLEFKYSIFMPTESPDSRHNRHRISISDSIVSHWHGDVMDTTKSCGSELRCAAGHGFEEHCANGASPKSAPVDPQVNDMDAWDD